MWVGEDGRLLGSVTIGGCVDAEVMAEAEDVLAASRPKLLSLDLGDEDAWEIGLTCGGTIEVFVEPVALGEGPAADGALALYEKVRAHVAAGGSGGHPHAHGRPGWRRQAPPARRRAPRGVAGRPTLDEAGPAAAQRGPRHRRLADRRPGPRRGGPGLRRGARAARDPAWSAGATSRCRWSTLAKALGYRTVVIDGRPRFATRERFPAWTSSWSVSPRSWCGESRSGPRPPSSSWPTTTSTTCRSSVTPWPARRATSACSGAGAAGTRSSGCSARRACPKRRSRGSGCPSASISARRRRPRSRWRSWPRSSPPATAGTGRPPWSPSAPGAGRRRRAADRRRGAGPRA